MPTYQEVLDADPAGFEACGGEFEGAADGLSSVRERYRSHIDGIGADWTGEDHARVREEGADLERRVSDLEASLSGRAAILKTLGPVLALAVEDLQRTDQELRDAGYAVDPAPRVSAAARPAEPDPFGPTLQALDELTAETATVLLQMMHRAVVILDETMADALESGELPAGRVPALLGEWGGIAQAAEAVRARLVEPSSWDARAPRTVLTDGRTTEAALGVAARFAAPRR